MHTNPFKAVTPAREQINIVTLGCSKNLVDSEVLLGQLLHSGKHATHEDPSGGSGIVVINTCGFIDEAKEESILTILDQVSRKERGEIEKVIVTGCLSARYQEELKLEMPQVDAWYGNHQDLPRLIQDLGADYKKELVGERKITSDGHYAYLKIAEGCNRPCSFCAIPLMRGKHQSRSIDDLVAESAFLVSKGVKEIMLIAQDLTYYGLDLYGSRRLAELLQRLAALPGLEWIRLHYAYPSGFPMEVIPVMRAHSNICNYLDMPLQHISDPVLKAMRRGITRSKTIDLINKIRDELPEITLRTTFLVGHPGEQEEDHEALLQFVEEQRFDRVGVFTYSHEEATHAGETMQDLVSEEVKEQRKEDILDLQQGISLELNRAKIGQRLRCLIDRREGDQYLARTEGDSPEVDNEVILQSKKQLQIGAFYEVTITDAMEYDLIGKL